MKNKKDEIVVPQMATSFKTEVTASIITILLIVGFGCLPLLCDKEYSPLEDTEVATKK